MPCIKKKICPTLNDIEEKKFDYEYILDRVMKTNREMINSEE